MKPWREFVVVGIASLAACAHATASPQREPNALASGVSRPAASAVDSQPIADHSGLVIVDEGRLIDGPLGPSVLVASADWREQAASSLLDVTYTAMLPYVQEPLVDEPIEEAITKSPAATARGFLQNFNFDATWVPALGGNDLGYTELGASTTVAVPFPTRKLPLLITPLAEMTLIDGPNTPDLPPRVYDTSIQFRWLWLIGEDNRWIVDLSVDPGLHGDFTFVDDDTFRIPARALGICQITPSVLLAVGVVYLDRDDDYNILPAAGLIWTPSSNWRIEAVVPRPSIAWKVAQSPYDDVESYWLYAAGELGGGTWTIERAGGRDVVTASDFRIVAGLEHRYPPEISTRYELAYVFNRQLDYQSPTPEFFPDDTILLRVGLKY